MEEQTGNGRKKNCNVDLWQRNVNKKLRNKVSLKLSIF